MKIFQQWIIVLLLPCVFLISRCAKEDPDLSISPGIYAYTPTMSSVPGIELIAVFERDLKNKNVKYHWVAEQGIFLTWHDEGKGVIKTLGPDIKTNVHKVYWSADPAQSIEAEAFQVSLAIEDIETSAIYAKASLVIKQAKNEAGAH